jgi:hypothetical protein
MKKFISLCLGLILLFTYSGFSQVGLSAANPYVITTDRAITVGGATADTLAYGQIKNYYFYVNNYATLAKAQLNIARTTGSTANGTAAKMVLMSSMDAVRWVRMDSTATITSQSTTATNYGISAATVPNAPYIRVWIINTENYASRIRSSVNILFGHK